MEKRVCAKAEKCASGTGLLAVWAYRFNDGLQGTIDVMDNKQEPKDMILLAALKSVKEGAKKLSKEQKVIASLARALCDMVRVCY